MKSIFTLLFALVLMTTSYASVLVEAPAKKPAEIMVPIGKTGQYISLAELSTIKVRQWEALTGTKLTLKEKVAFKLAQVKMKAELKQHEATGQYKPVDFKDPVEKWMWFWIFGWGLGFVFLFIPHMGILSSLFFLFGSVSLIIWLIKKFA